MKFKALIFSALLLAGATLLSGFVISPNKIKNKTITIPEVKKENFAEFLSHFPKIEMPFELKLEDLKPERYDRSRVASKKRISKKKGKAKFNISPIARSEFIPEASFSFGRMGPPQLEVVGRFFPNKKSIAVIYTSKSRFNIGGLGENYHLLIYDLKGNIVFPQKEKDQKRVYAGFLLAYKNMVNTVTCQIDKEGYIWKKTYENEWEKDVKEQGYVENEITSYTITDTEIFKLNDKGIAVELKELPVTDRASLD